MKILFDEGRRYPAACVTGRQHILVVSDGRGIESDPRAFCAYTLGDTAVPWGATASTGAWRTFAELPLGDPAQVTAFLQRWGDPTDDNQRDPAYQPTTATWSNLQNVLHTAATGWDPPQADGVCEFTRDAERARFAQYIGAFGSPMLLDNLVAAVLPDGALGYRARTTRAYLTGTAILAVQNRVAMRCCDRCSGWYEVRRRGGRFCSATCRATAHNTAQEAG
jgi:hypothetical protein